MDFLYKDGTKHLSNLVFIIIPFVGAFFIHINNSIIVQVFHEWMF